jgi:hypothetical protein
MTAIYGCVDEYRETLKKGVRALSTAVLEETLIRYKSGNFTTMYTERVVELYIRDVKQEMKLRELGV